MVFVIFINRNVFGGLSIQIISFFYLMDRVRRVQIGSRHTHSIKLLLQPYLIKPHLFNSYLGFIELHMLLSESKF